MHKLTLVATICLLGIVARPAAADMLEYPLPGTPYAILLQGKVKVLPGGNLEFRHKLGKLYFKLGTVDWTEVPSVQSQSRTKLGRAKTADACMDAARWALHRGALEEFQNAVDKALELDPGHTGAKRVVELRRMIAEPVEDNGSAERLRDLFNKPQMKIERSAHYVMLHDTPDIPGNRASRAQQRIKLMERVYESFLYKFFTQGKEGERLLIPKEPLLVVLFNERDDYLKYSTRLASDLASTAGFYSPAYNISVFYDQGSNAMHQQMAKMDADLKKQVDELKRRRAPGVGDLVRYQGTMSILTKLVKENDDIEVVTHEATHQLAANTGLLPREIRVPSWVHEGLASYFESPGEAGWSGVGAVNEERLKWYRALANQRDISKVDFIVGDQIFSYAMSNGATLHAYGQAWALTHFLINQHFPKYMAFCDRLGHAPANAILSQEVLNRMFNEAFGDDRKGLDAQWHAYMSGLKTDKEVLLESR